MLAVVLALTSTALAMATLMAAVWLTTPAAHAADSIEVKDAQLDATDDGWTLRAEFGLDLSGRLEEAINKGVPLYFNFEFELTRPRWYWLDEKAVQASQTYRLSYHALTQSYRLSAGTLYQSFPTLNEALRLLARPRMTAFSRQQIKPGEAYVGQVRLRLDTAQLPKPFQINALTSREWNLDSDWKKIPFRYDGAATGGPAGAGPAGTAGAAAK
jgi:Domain of unknown function (DUF4390)